MNEVWRKTILLLKKMLAILVVNFGQFGKIIKIIARATTNPVVFLS